jgi:predicted nucleic acid-binding protein
MLECVVDNSVVCGWFLGNQANAYSDALAGQLTDARLWTPALWELELANVLRTACQRGAMHAQQAHEIVAALADLPLTVDRDAPGASALLALALRYDLTSYDAAYLELALRLQKPLATRDAALADAARASGVGVWAA